ncbi:MAG: cytochrome c [Aquihabitans sp.]
MTEIPEHLLKRAKERRAAKSGGGDAPADTPAAVAPADAAPAAPAAPTSAKPPAPLPTLGGGEAKAVPDIAVVAAAKRRKRVPYWAATVLVLLPLWGFIYYNAVKPAGQGPTDPMVLGAEVYVGSAGCQGCHTPDGAGGPAGAQLNQGHTLETFADPLSMVHWIGYGFAGGQNGDDTYGDVNRPKVAGSMPPFKDSLTPEEIAAVTIYIRNEFGGDAYDPETEQGFTVEGFEADPEAIIAEVEAALALGEGAPDVSEIPRAGG